MRGTNYDRSAGWLGLAAAMLEKSADLYGAACTSMPRMFDPDIPSAELGLTNQERWSAVQAACIGCPVRASCWAWATQQHSGRISGPTAATMATPFTSRGHRRRMRYAQEHDNREAG